MKTENKRMTPLEGQFIALLEKAARPCEFYEIAKGLNVANNEVDTLVRKFTREKVVYRSLGRRIGLLKDITIHTGTISAHPKGFGFVNSEDDLEGFVPPPQMSTLVGGDVVEFAMVTNPRDGKTAAEIISLVSRPQSFWLGTLEDGPTGKVFKADEGLNPVIELSMGSVAAQVGDTIQITIAANARTVVQNRIASVKATALQTLGKRGRPGFDTDYAIAKWLIPTSFSQSGASQADAYPETTPLEQSRVDLRNLPFVTIDGESTRDFDDAIYAETVAGAEQTRLVVAIADVAHYVTQDSALDVDAATRGNSVYFPERVIPMLPERLSNVLCSLNPGADRYAMVCDMVIDNAGVVQAFKFYPALMRSHARLTYTQVAKALEGENTVDAMLMPMVYILDSLHLAMRGRRKEAGMLEFDSREPKLIVVNDEIVDIEWEETNVAHHIVEECMLAANRSAAAFLKEHGVSPMYRHHAAPEGEEWDEARAKLQSLGFALSDVASMSEMGAILDSTRENENFGIIEENLRKAMRPAVYDTQNSSHFSLGFDEYTHFTSPIRRYPDLLVHRAIKAVLAGATAHVFDSETLAKNCGETSRRADRATRFVWNLIKRRHMAKYVGSEQLAKFVLGNKRGAKVVLLDFDCAAWMTADSLLAKGYVWDDPTQVWNGPSGLEAGVRVKATIKSADELDVSVALS